MLYHTAFITLIPLPPQSKLFIFWLVSKFYNHNNYATDFSFLVLPSDGIFPSTTEATFCCQHPNATSIIWRVNGTVFKDLNSELNISFSGSNNREGVLHTLTIPALSIYNGTTVECIAKDIIGILPASNNISSPSVTLLIQGSQY